jgi:hypothetical protein
MHLFEPFVHRYIIRGTFSRDDSKGWHTNFLILWVIIYTNLLLALSPTFIECLDIIAQGLGLRFVAQSILLNVLMVKDGHNGRTWHDLRDTGVDGIVQKVVKYPVALILYQTFPQNVTSNIKMITEKAAIVTAVLLTIIIIAL